MAILSIFQFCGYRFNGLFMQHLLYVANELPFLPDGGPAYTETSPGSLIVEPWNAISSFFILLPAVYWFWKLKGHYRDHLFITFCLPLLFLGGLGSAIYHGFRVSPFFLIMDVLPTAILMLAVTAYFWYQVIYSWILTILIILFTIGIRVMLFYWWQRDSHIAINISYAVSGIVFFLPVVILVVKTRFRYAILVMAAIASFILALFFRQVDPLSGDYLPMGTHFLWHLFTGIGGFLLAEYLYFISSRSKKHWNERIG